MGQYDWLSMADPATVFTAFDTETTGLDPRKNRVIEIGAVQFDTSGIMARFSVLINPERPMPEEASRINGITDAMLAGKPVAAEVLQDFLSFIGTTVLVAHNAPFDISFMNEEFSRLMMPPLSNRVVDTRILAKEVFPGLPRYALQDLAKHFGIEAKDAHRAEDDAKVCYELFRVCRKNQSR
jgi:DNA polymerase-3 subunit epsilon